MEELSNYYKITQGVFGSPNPLVSSSGIIHTQTPPNDEDGQNYIKNDVKRNAETRADQFSEPDSMIGKDDSDELHSAVHIAKNSVPEDFTFPILSKISQKSEPTPGEASTGVATFDLDENPLLWNLTSFASKKSSVEKKKKIGRKNNNKHTNEDDLSENVVYSKAKKAVLHPYTSDDSSVVTIPTEIITPPTAKPPSHYKSYETVTIPQQTQGQAVIINQRVRDTNTTSAIDGGEVLANNSNEIVVNSPKFVLLNENTQLENSVFDDSEKSLRIVRTSSNETNTNNKENKTTENAGPKTSKAEEESEDNDEKTKSSTGPPWEDDSVVGKLNEDAMVEPTEVSFKIASKLCQKLAGQSSSTSNAPKRYYLWAPINQYLPLVRKAFPIRPPLFAPECLKWVLRQCRGTIRLPLLKPCTYWSPMPIRRPECGFNPTLQFKMVNYRIPEYIPGNCPCVWPCITRFDPIQRCRVPLNESEHQMDEIHSDGDPSMEKEILIQENLGAQLCRGMKLAMTVDNVIPIGWIPIRADVVFDSTDNDNIVKPSEGSGSLRRKREQKVKREKIFVKPGKNSSVSSEEDDDKGNVKNDRFTLMGTYNLDRQVSQNANGTSNMTTIKKCNVWKYKACPRDKTSQESQGSQRRKRNVPSYMSSLTIGFTSDDGINTLFENQQRAVRQAEVDEDDLDFEKVNECGEWIQTESFHCIPEEHIQVGVKVTPGSSSEEDDDKDDGDKSKMDNKKSVMKNLCPGSVGRFPCFLRKKRDIDSKTSVDPATGITDLQDFASPQQDKLQKKRDTIKSDLDQEETLPPSSSVYLINKIQIRPDPGCLCEWPCLPFFDRVNQCYNSKGDILLNNLGRPKVPARSFRKSQRDPVVCINFVESDEIYCKVKE